MVSGTKEMSNHEYEHRHLFCDQVKMKKKKLKIDVTTFPGLCFGVSFPLQDYVDCTICILCFGIHIKWRKK
jgi:hypothetical protein